MAAAPEQLLRPSSSSPPPAITRTLDSALVHPTSPPPSPPETSLPLTFYDVFWLRAPTVQRVLLYRLAPHADVDAVLANLKRSLSLALGAFFPLAGRLRLTPGGAAANRYELHYRPGDAVIFTIAESDDNDVDTLSTDEPREVSKLAPLAPPLPAGGGAVLALQVTVLRGGGSRCGLALGVTVHHAACDGAASTHFLRTWAAACAGTQPFSAPPVMDRTLVSDPTGLYDAFYKPVSPSSVVTNKSTDDDKLFATFVLSMARLQRIKDVVAVTRGVAPPPPRCTSLVAALGLVWSCYQRAKPAGVVNSEKTCLLFTVDHRSRRNPPLPEHYFGNCVGSALATASTGELAAGGLWAACAAIAAAIEAAVGGVGTASSMVAAKERVREAVTTMDVLTVAGSPRFRVYELDFGFGPPAKVDVVSVARTGAVAVADSRAGGGGIEVGVCLPPDGMAAFRKCFADAVAGLDMDDDAGARH